MTDWTTVATAGITGFTGLAGGYFVARLQAKAEARKILAAQREARRADRESAYLGFLDVERRAASFLMALPPQSPGDFQKELDDFNHQLNATLLLGTPVVRAAAGKLAGLYFNLFMASGFDTRSWDDAMATFKEGVKAGFTARQTARDELLRLMTRDLGHEAAEAAAAGVNVQALIRAGKH